MSRLRCSTCGRFLFLHRLTSDWQVRCPIYAGKGPHGVPILAAAAGAMLVLGVAVGLFASVPSWTAPKARPVIAKAEFPPPRPFVPPVAAPAPPVQAAAMVVDPFAPNQDLLEPVGNPLLKEDWLAFSQNFRRIQKRNTDALSGDLSAVPQVGMTPTRDAQWEVVRTTSASNRFKGPVAALTVNPELKHLPYTKGGECVLEDDDAAALELNATKIRRNTRFPFGFPHHAIKDQFVLAYTRPAAVPALSQIMQSEETSVRQAMVEVMGRLSDPRAAETLVRRAVFDLDPQVRMQAVYALKHRPADQYRERLLALLNHPWDAAVQHAAEAIVNLDDAVPLDHLKVAARNKEPRTLVSVDKTLHVREMVRMNHINNCLVCHALSKDPKDHVRAPVPEPYTQPSPLYYADRQVSDILVRADVTYLRQDFSVMQQLSLEEAGIANKNPNLTYRFDFLVRTRPLREGEEAAAGDDDVRSQALSFAIKNWGPAQRLADRH